MQKSKFVLFAFFVIFLNASCNNEEEELPAPENSLDADPSLNQFLFTSMRETIYALDPATGESLEITPLIGIII